MPVPAGFLFTAPLIKWYISSLKPLSAILNIFSYHSGIIFRLQTKDLIMKPLTEAQIMSTCEHMVLFNHRVVSSVGECYHGQ